MYWRWLRIRVDIPVAQWLRIQADDFYLFNDLSARIVRLQSATEGLAVRLPVSVACPGGNGYEYG